MSNRLTAKQRPQPAVVFSAAHYQPLNKLTLYHGCNDAVTQTLNPLLINQDKPNISGYASGYSGHQFGVFIPVPPGNA